MTYNPDSLKELGAYWTAQGGVNLGVVGNTAHTQGYHLGKDRIYDGSGPGIGDNDYSVKTARDKAGLTNAASAIDLGRLDGSLKALRMFSTWLVAEARKNAPGTSDLREIIYSPDGATVLRWDRQRGYSSAPRTGEADDSHLTHTHISWYRDAQARDHTTAFRPYFEEEPDDMPTFTVYATPKVAAVRTGTWLYDNEALQPSPANIQVDPGRDMPIAGKLANGKHIVGYVDTTPGETDLRSYFVRTIDITVKDAVGPPPPDQTPYDEGDLTEAREAGAEAEQERIAEAEAERLRNL
jgi:hypothetical protein